MEKTIISLSEYRRKQLNSFFSKAYLKLQLNNKLNEAEINNLLRNAIIFTNFGDNNLQKMGYKIFISYSNKYYDYKPLYDYSINKGFYPISKYIEQKYLSESISDHFYGLFTSSFHENYREKNYYISNGQKQLIEYSKNNDSNFLLVAPTSYGKSEIIVNKVLANINKKICVIVPSKALLAQTKKRIINSSTNGGLLRVITHPDMFKGTEISFVAVLTQERLLRLLQKNISLYFDLVLIDEAHNMFGTKKHDSRSTLLSQTILILKNRNQNVVLNFFSPFISNPDNLIVKQSDYKVSSQKTNEYIKSEKFYICDLAGSHGVLRLYEQFSNTFADTAKKYHSLIELLKSEKAAKNIFYLNRPKHIEELANEYSDTLDNIGVDINDITKTISEFVHPEYNLIKCIRKGIVYHHGGMPEIIRLYVENIFSKYSNLNVIISSSTLLEGVNIPAEKIFILSTKKGRSNMTASQFKNLIGRVNRFSEIFNQQNGNLELLEPHVYIVKSKYSDKKANIENYIKKNARIEVKYNDDVNNVMLKEEDALTAEEKDELKNSLEYLENIEPKSTKLIDVDYAVSEIAKQCYRNNIYDFDIKSSEGQLVENLSNYRNSETFSQINDPNQLLDAINTIFFKDVVITDNNIKRLQNDSARRFYSLILEWRSTGASFREMIGSFMGYWSSLIDDEQLVFIGDRWGEEKRSSRDMKPLYVDLRKKSNAQKVNLAILKIKEEQDFIEYNLLKYIDVISELKMIESVFYDKIKYGSSDVFIINLLKNGFSIELAKCVSRNEYSGYILIGTNSDEIIIQPKIIDEMHANGENDILIFEIKYHINEQ